jgi:hypothetical protein
VGVFIEKVRNFVKVVGESTMPLLFVAIALFNAIFEEKVNLRIDHLSTTRTDSSTKTLFTVSRSQVMASLSRSP